MKWMHVAHPSCAGCRVKRSSSASGEAKRRHRAVRSACRIWRTAQQARAVPPNVTWQIDNPRFFLFGNVAMRRFTLLMLSMLQTLPAAAAESAAPADLGKTHCESRSVANDLQEVECQLKDAGPARHFTFSAQFSGGHDDTLASMTPSLNGQPLACLGGSKTRLMGEDGEVGLHCHFAVAGDEGVAPVLKVLLKWSHAQYVNFGLAAEPR
jgi:hypothetical protein